MYRILTSLILLLLLSSQAYADARSSAVTDFLIQRAEDNALYMFQLRLKRNEELACHFPQTYQYIKDGELRLLMKSSQAWSEAIESDLKTMAIRYAAAEINQALDFKKLALDFTDQFIEVSQFLEIKHNGEKYPINFISLSTPPELRTLINNIYNEPVALRDQLLKVGAEFSTLDSTTCTPQTLSALEIQQLASDLQQAIKQLKPWSEQLQKQAKLLTINKPALEKHCKVDPQVKTENTIV